MTLLRISASEGKEYDVELTDQELAIYNLARSRGALHVDVDEQTESFTTSSQSNSGQREIFATGTAKHPQGS